MNHSVPAILIFVLTLLFSGACGTSKEQSAGPTPTPSPQPEAPVSFRTSTDTVATAHDPDEANGETREGDPNIRYMVQIGAFQDPANASAVQLRARERYHIPVLNDYHTGLGLYQVRMGFFEDYESAGKFRSQLIQDHPAEYRDAWIVQLKR